MMRSPNDSWRVGGYLVERWVPEGCHKGGEPQAQLADHARAASWPQQSAHTQPPLLLLQGAGLVSTCWSDLLPSLAEREVITVDRPGYRGSSPRGPRSLEEEAQALEAIVDSAGLDTVLLVAHSMVAFHAEAMARRCPDRVAGVVFVDPSALSELLSGIPPALTPVRAMLQRLSVGAAWTTWKLSRATLALPGGRQFGAALFRVGARLQTRRPVLLRRPGWAEAWASHEALRAGLDEWYAYSGQAAALRTERGVHPEALPQPAIILDAPPSLSRRQRARITAIFPRAEIRHLPHSRHLVMLDAPEEITQAITDVLTQLAVGHE